MVQPQVDPLQALRNAIAQGEVQLNPAAQLPLTRDELAARILDLTRGFNEARASEAEAKMVNRGVDVAVRLKEGAAKKAAESTRLITEAAATYQRHFGEDDQEAPAPPTP